MKLPFVLVGDHPEAPTGLGRILGDLARQIHRDFGEILDVRVVGWMPWGGIPETGVEQVWTPDQLDPYQGLAPFTTWVFNDTQHNWGASSLVHAYRQWFGSRDGIVLTVWDPGRCLPYAMVPLPVVKWGYFAIDAENVNGGISGPAAEAIRRYDRVLGYTQFGAKILDSVAGSHAGTMHLPHGIHCSIFQPNRTSADVARAQTILRVTRPERHVIGTVATNQPRKDWGMVAQTLKLLVERGHDVHGWWHTDKIVSEAWSLPQLALDLGLEDRLTYTTALNDLDLAKCYGACVATIAPGRGEGFCYPIIESNACGTPAYHVNYAGGAEILPDGVDGDYHLPVQAYHLVGPYALRRPIVFPRDVADRLERHVNGLPSEAALIAERARMRAHALRYDWGAVWPGWRAWINRGLGKA